MTKASGGQPDSHRARLRPSEWALVGAAAAFLIAGVVLAIVFLPERLSPVPAEVSGFRVAALRSARRIIDYEQPSPELVARISVVHQAEEKDVSSIPSSLSGVDVVIVGRVPFVQYWQNTGENQYIFHPLAYGRILLRLADDPDVLAYLDKAVEIGHFVRGDGLLWYYPDRYDLARFLGPDLAPSAIAQGVLLESVTVIDAAVAADLSKLARSVFEGLAFDYYRGGLNLEDLALLEIPLFRSPPEIILNGWLAALLHLRSYAEAYDDGDARRLFNSNVRFLARSLERFHDPVSGLSRYSDLCPYRVVVEWDDGEQHDLVAFYRALVPELDDLAFDLGVIEHSTRSSFDNQVIRWTSGGAEAWVSCSQNYDTYLVSTGGPFTVTFETGAYEPTRSTPGRGGRQIVMASTLVSGHHVAHITSIRNELFCGYPTNFSKNGENYYHAYHVVALACLLALDAVPQDLVPEAGRWMNHWFEAAESTTRQRGLTFTEYQKELDGVIRNGTSLPSERWDELLVLAKGRIAQDSGRP